MKSLQCRRNRTPFTQARKNFQVKVGRVEAEGEATRTKLIANDTSVKPKISPTSASLNARTPLLLVKHQQTKNTVRAKKRKKEKIKTKLANILRRIDGFLT